MHLAVTFLLFGLFASTSVAQVAIVHGDFTTASVQDVFNKLSKYYNVTVINAKTSTPSLSMLIQYNAVLSWPAGGYYDAVGLGTVFKQYVDAGYGLVMCMFAFDNVTSNDALRGLWNNNYWGIIPQNTYLNSGDSTLNPLISGHPILNGVTSFDGGSFSYRGGAWGPSTLRVASWSDGTPMVGVINIGSAVRVDLAFYPPSSDGCSGCWVSSTQGARLMVNALAFTMNTGSCSSYSTCNSCATNKCQWCLDTNSCSSPSTSCPDRIVNPLDCPTKCEGSKCTTCLSVNKGLCSWCLDNNSCILKTSTICRGEINNIKFCPSLSVF